MARLPGIIMILVARALSHKMKDVGFVPSKEDVAPRSPVPQSAIR